MGLINIRLGDYIERSTINNKDLKYGFDLIVGVNSQGVFATPKGNTDGVDLKPYKIVENGAFVYNPTRLELGSIAYRTEGLCIVSHLYMVFYLTDEGKKIIDPMWLYIYFRRSEFCREVTFRNFGSQRPEFNFNDMSDIVIPLPDIEIQKKYVDVYNAMLENQKSYESGLDDLKLVCDAYIEDLRRQMPCEAIGLYIEERNEKNIDNAIDLFQGVNVDHVFTEPKRVAEDSENGSVVRTGQFAFNKVMKAHNTKLPIERLLANGFISTLNESIFERDDDEIVLCLGYDGLYGVNNINRYMQKINPSKPIEWGNWTYKVGDKVLFNESRRFGNVLYNNLKGSILSIDKKTDEIVFQILVDKTISERDVLFSDIKLIDCDCEGKSIVEFSVKRRVERDSDSDYSEQIVPFQIAYAVSIHKAQGLEYKSVKVVITEDIDEKISHNIFYTAITRTTDKLKIYMSKETQKKLAEKFVKSNVGLKQAQLFAGQAGLKLKNKLSS